MKALHQQRMCSTLRKNEHPLLRRERQRRQHTPVPEHVAPVQRERLACYLFSHAHGVQRSESGWMYADSLRPVIVVDASLVHGDVDLCLREQTRRK